MDPQFAVTASSHLAPLVSHLPLATAQRLTHAVYCPSLLVAHILLPAAHCIGCYAPLPAIAVSFVYMPVDRFNFVLSPNYNEGHPHCIKIPNSLYVPGLKICLLLSQHWVQEAGDNCPLLHGTRMENKANNCTLIWGQGSFMVLVDPVHSLYIIPGYV